jgi:hypothetical protein
VCSEEYTRFYYTVYPANFAGIKKAKVLYNSTRLSLLEVVPPGFEPRQTEPKTVVLPLHHGTITVWGCKCNNHLFYFQKNTVVFYKKLI